MRIYTKKIEVISEIKRDLVEMWQPVSTYSMQNKIVEWNHDYDTKEIINYAFCLSDIDNIEDLIYYDEFKEAEQKRINKYFETEDVKSYIKYIKEKFNIDLKDLEDIRNKWDTLLKIWLSEDFWERIRKDINPWEAWKVRPWVWEEFLWNKEWDIKKFDYTYSERIQVNDLLEQIAQHPTSRQYILNIWDRKDRTWVNWERRIPCSLNYQILIRPNWERDDEGKEIQFVNLIYNMRSCDFLTHFPVDIIQAVHLMKFVTKRLNTKANTELYQPWKLFYNCASLHLYRKDLLENVF